MGTLRQYQAAGVEFAKDRPAVLLHVDRGLGKTVIEMVDIEHQLQTGRVKKVLYIAPLSTLDHVVEKAREFAPSAVPVIIYGDRQKRKALIEGRGNLHVINFDGVRIMAAELDRANYDMVVVDELYNIKDPDTQVSRITKALGRKAKVRRGLTGMLFAESIEQAWNQIDFLDRTIFPRGPIPFKYRYCQLADHEFERIKMELDPRTGKKRPVFREVQKVGQEGPPPMIPDPYGSDKWIPQPGWGKTREVVKEIKKVKKVVGVRHLDEFARLIAKLTYRADRATCLPELPPRTFQVLKVKMVEAQARLYARVYKEIRTEYQGSIVDHKWAMTKIQKLHQIASGFLYDNDRETLFVPSGKFQVLTEQLETGLVDHDKAVIFTAFRAEPPLVAHAVEQMSRPMKVYVLPEKGEDRQRAIDEWSEWTHSPAVFIANVASGGVGLNLQAAHTAIFFSNDYKLQGREQAVDRVYRMGSEQHDKILIQDLVTEGTVDEDILEALTTKKSVVDIFLSKLKEETSA